MTSLDCNTTIQRIRNELQLKGFGDVEKAEIVLRNKDEIREAIKTARERSFPLYVDLKQIPLGLDLYQILAMIAGTSRAAVQRTNYILKRGTPEQIERARKGNLTSVWREISGNNNEKPRPIVRPVKLIPQTETKICSICGKQKPISEFCERRSYCRECKRVKDRKYKKFRDPKGQLYKDAPELEGITEEDVIGNLYDVDRDCSYTPEDLAEELKANADDYFASLEGCIERNRELLTNEKGREAVAKHLSYLFQKIYEEKEKYTHERISV